MWLFKVCVAFSFLNYFSAGNWATNIKILGHVALVATDARLAVLSVSLVSRILIVIVQDLTCDDIYAFVSIGEFYIFSRFGFLCRLSRSRILTHICRLILRHLVLAQRILLFACILPCLDWPSSLVIFRNLCEACFIEAAIHLLCHLFLPKNYWRLIVFDRLPSSLRSRILNIESILITNKY